MRFKGTIATLLVATSVAWAGDLYGQESIEARIERLERAFEARQSGQSNMLQQLNLLQREISELRGITEEHANQLEQILERQRDLYQEIERRLADPKTGQIGATGTSSFDEPARQPSVQQEENAYDRGIRLVLEERRYDQAIPEFQRFIANNPDSEYVGNAHYWLGQLYFVQKNHSEAKTHFRQVVDHYQDSSKRADCMLKLGMIELAENNRTAARNYFNQVQKEYPNSTEAGMASRQLESMEQ